MAEKKIKFEEYDWDKWMQEVGSKLYFSGGNEEEALHKYKLKYFKKHVDPDFEIPSSSQPKQNDNINNSNNSSSNSNGSGSNSNSNNNHQQNQQNGREQAPQRRAPRAQSNFNLTQRLWAFASISVILNSIFFYIPIFYWIFGFEIFEPRSAYSRALLSAVGVYLISLGYEIGFPPSLTKEYFTKFAKSENTHYITVCLVVFSLPSVLLLFLMTLALTQLYTLLRVLDNFPQFKFPIFQKILANQQYIITYCCICEVMTFPLLFSMVIFGGGIQEVVCCFVYFQFLQNRYVNNPLIRMIFQQLRIKISELTRRPFFPPVVNRLFEGLCNYLYRITTHQPAAN